MSWKHFAMVAKHVGSPCNVILFVHEVENMLQSNVQMNIHEVLVNVRETHETFFVKYHTSLPQDNIACSMIRNFK